MRKAAKPGIEEARLKRQAEKRKKTRDSFKIRKGLRKLKNQHPLFEIAPDGSIFLGTIHIYTHGRMKQHEPYFDKIASALRREPGRFEIFLEAPYPELRSIDEVPLGPSEESVMKRLSKELKIHLKTFRSGFFSMDTLRKLGNKRKASIAIAYWTKDLIDSLEGLGYTKQRAREIVLKGAQTKASRLGIELEYFQGILQSISGKRIPSKEIAEAILEIRDISNVSMERTIRNGLKESKASKFIFVVGGQHFSAVKRAHNRYLREKEKSVSGTP